MLYDNYKELYSKANEYFWQDGAKPAKIEEYSHKLKDIRERFTKADWEELIAQSHGRAKYEYTKMMNEKFPTGK